MRRKGKRCAKSIFCADHQTITGRIGFGFLLVSPFGVDLSRGRWQPQGGLEITGLRNKHTGKPGRPERGSHQTISGKRKTIRNLFAYSSSSRPHSSRRWLLGKPTSFPEPLPSPLACGGGPVSRRQRRACDLESPHGSIRGQGVGVRWDTPRPNDAGGRTAPALQAFNMTASMPATGRPSRDLSHWPWIE